MVTVNRVLLIEDDGDLREAMTESLMLAGFTVDAYKDGDRALAATDADYLGVVLTDLRLPGSGGDVLLTHFQQIDADLPVIMVTGHGDISTAVECLQAGAYDFLEKPIDMDRLTRALKQATEKRQLVMQNRYLTAKASNLQDSGQFLLGHSEPIQAVRNLIKTIAKAEVDVLIMGETGTGKEMVARSIHRLSSRQNAPFVAVNCGALPQDLIDAELFGHEKGAYTDARTTRQGRFERANGGVIFLDEIESMPLNSQTRLLRVLQEREVERLGGSRPISLDIKVLSSTKADLLEMVRLGTFREDLYYRLSVVEIDLPRLAERGSDIVLLFQHFLQQHHRDDADTGGDSETPLQPLSEEVIDMLQSYDWPGNVRELKNAAQRYYLGLPWRIIVPQRKTEQTEHPASTSSARISDEFAAPDSDKSTQSLADQVASYEQRLIEAALTETEGRLTEVMERLQLPRKTLQDKMKKYHLQREDFTR